ncbi:MAG: YbaB/EbfC family nucleoid-associated protein [Desulfobulbaceae bacterium]|jgi:DNA-binding YbaB/EbfC family protein|nr:YbaB/EbfC family nucleoid-associated protein [Desulfobulbaceae bacterium]HKJ13549.1 YbaB/EbfC family nucleoid-associated protein [Desulfobulbales bacterium]MDH3776095.1 YbaB/EbfC family nucleoid-associated protein [Desulfobulbaceae bacterium]MDH3781786.1 YbaB/EbfC family nucleoid-associated protein [Desulfobulbaceae bacterium]MDH3866332.1 YbaB/EbfC family nucleoid-associated protein [Desulfobulbaceae bacterium]
MDMNEIMRQAQQMQQKMSQVQNELAGRTVTASVGGGMVSVTLNGKNELLSVQIDREVINPEDREMLQDLIVSAVNEGLKKAQDMAQAEMRKITGGINIPGIL